MSFLFSPSDLPPEALLSVPVSFFGAAKVMPFFFFPNFFANFFKLFFRPQKPHRLWKSGCKDIIFISYSPNLFLNIFEVF